MKTKLISLLLIVLMLLPAPFAAADQKDAANAEPALSFSTETLSGDPIGDETTQGIRNAAHGSLLFSANKPVITAQPKNATAAVGKKVKFSVSASGSDLTYQWYYRVSSAAKWKRASFKSAKNATLRFTAKETYDGYQYRCIIKSPSGQKCVSKTVTLHTGCAPEIETQPADKTVQSGAKATFRVAAEGEELTYQWYYRTSSKADWKAVTGTSGKKSAYTVTMSSKKNGYQYRCLVKNPFGKVYSSIAKLKLKKAETIGDTYILNTNTMKFHRPNCRYVKTIDPDNKEEYTGSRADLIELGYEACKVCKP